MNLGLIATNISSKLGILSKKACMRYATEVGKKMADKSAELGRQANFNEITEIINETMPKHCKPKIITTSDEIAQALINTGFSSEQASSYSSSLPAAAAVFINGFGKRPIYIPSGTYNSPSIAPLYAHELTHALEFNCSPKGIYYRIKAGLKIKFGKMFKKNYIDKTIENDLKIHSCEGSLSHYTGTQFMPGSTLEEYKKANTIKCKIDSTDFERYINVSREYNGEALENPLQLTNKNRYLSHIRDCIRETLGSSRNYGAGLIKRLNLFKGVIKAENSAYTVQADVERYMLNLTDTEVTRTEGRAYLCKQAEEIAKQEKINYIKNLLLGRLRKPKTYTSDKDIIKIVTNKEHKQHIKNIIKDSSITTEEKEKLFSILKTNPSIFDNPDIIYLSKIKDKDGFCFLMDIDNIAKLKNEQIKKIIDIANYKNNNGINIYKYDILDIIDHPEFERISSIIQTEIDGKNPYIYTIKEIADLPPDKFLSICSRIKSATADGIDISGEIDKELGTKAYGNINISSLHGRF